MLKKTSNVTAKRIEKVPAQYYRANEKKTAHDTADCKKGNNRFQIAAF